MFLNLGGWEGTVLYAQTAVGGEGSAYESKAQGSQWNTIPLALYITSALPRQPTIRTELFL